MKNMRNMKTLSRTLMVSVAVAVVAMNVYCNDAGGADRTADSRAKIEPYSPVSAYINVRGPVDEQAMLEALTESYARLATIKRVLLRSVDNDVDGDGKRRERITGCKYYTADKKGIIKNLQRDLRVTSVRGTNLIRVSMKTAEPPEQAAIVNAVADAIVAEAAQRHKRRIAMHLKNIGARNDELRTRVVAKKKMIQQIRGQSQVPLMKFRHTTQCDSLKTLSNTITSLKLQKALAEADLNSFKEKQKSGDLDSSLEIQSAVAGDPDVAALRAAILQSKISLLGDRDNRQLLIIQKQLKEMLAARQKVAVIDAIKRKSSKLETEIITVREKLLAVGVQYTEISARLRDLTHSIEKIEALQSDIVRIKQQAGKLDAESLRLRIKLGETPLTLIAPAETH